MIGDINVAQYFESFLQSLAQFFSVLSLFDYLFLALLVFFVIRGFIIGGAKIIIHGLWLFVALVLAVALHQPLTDLLAVQNFITNASSAYFVGFMALIALVYAVKYFIYKTLEKIAVLHGPCPFNRFLAMLIGYTVIVSLSWYIALDVHSGSLLVNLLVNDVLRFTVSFVIVLAVLIAISYVLMTLLNVKVGIDRPCPLIKALQPLDDILNAKSINSFSNSAGGSVIGVLQACMVSIIIFMFARGLGFADAIVPEQMSAITAELNIISQNVYPIMVEYLAFLQS